VQGLQGAHQQLQISTKKVDISKAALDELQKTPEGTRMLVPITSSLYVPGETAQVRALEIMKGLTRLGDSGKNHARPLFVRPS
jgi:prefoldin subunit 5